MAPQIAEPRKEISPYAPKIINMRINPDKIKDVIGSGGKTINKIIEDTGVKIDIEDDGLVFIYSDDIESARKAQGIIEEITREIEVNGIYTGKVTRIATFGAFIDLGGGKEGLLHISKISKERVNKVEDVFKVGDEVTVKVYEIDDQGRINLTRKDLYSADPE
jgi:polyribonucleotide nucleotidyltransferase